MKYQILTAVAVGFLLPACGGAGEPFGGDTLQGSGGSVSAVGGHGGELGKGGTGGSLGTGGGVGAGGGGGVVDICTTCDFSTEVCMESAATGGKKACVKSCATSCGGCSYCTGDNACQPIDRRPGEWPYALPAACNVVGTGGSTAGTGGSAVGGAGGSAPAGTIGPLGPCLDNPREPAASRCAPAYRCIKNICTLPDGQACNAPAQCSGGFCYAGETVLSSSTDYHCRSVAPIFSMTECDGKACTDTTTRCSMAVAEIRASDPNVVSNLVCYGGVFQFICATNQECSTRGLSTCGQVSGVGGICR